MQHFSACVRMGGTCSLKLRWKGARPNNTYCVHSIDTISCCPGHCLLCPQYLSSTMQGLGRTLIGSGLSVKKYGSPIAPQVWQQRQCRPSHVQEAQSTGVNRQAGWKRSRTVQVYATAAAITPAEAAKVNQQWYSTCIRHYLIAPCYPRHGQRGTTHIPLGSNTCSTDAAGVVFALHHFRLIALIRNMRLL